MLIIRKVISMNKILIIDDSDSWFDAVAAECEKAGFYAIRAMRHDEPLDLKGDDTISMVLVDLLVATKAGAGYIRQLRSQPKLKNAQMLLATAGTNAQSAMHAVGGRSAEVIAKDATSLASIAERLRKLPVAG